MSSTTLLRPWETRGDPVVALKRAADQKREECKAAYNAYEAERQRQINTDAEPDAESARRLDDLYRAHEAASADYEDIRDRWLNQVEGRAGTRRTGGLTDPGRYGKMSGIGAEFLTRLGAGVAGLKALDGTSGGTMVSAFFDPQISELPSRQLFVRSLIPTTTIDSDKVDYLRQSVATQNAAPVAKGALKPTSVFTVERIEERARTLAHLTEALDRALLSDFDQLVEFIDGQLRLGVLLAEESQILNGDGTGENFTGILNTAGIGVQAKGADSAADAIHKAITVIRQAFHEPDAVVLHPADWQTIRLSKTSDGAYLAAPIVEADPARLWGLQVITSPVIAAGTGLVGAFGIGSHIWDREQARVTFTEAGLGDAAGQELFTRNLVRFRGESRLAFGVLRPAAFAKITGLA